MSFKQHEGPGLPVHPPVPYLAVLLVGIGLNYLWPIVPMPGQWGSIVGVLLIILGAAIMPPVLARFRRATPSFDAI